jgi:hypothetical protein
LNYLDLNIRTKIAVVQLRRRKWAERDRKRPKMALRPGAVVRTIRQNGGILRASGPDEGGEKECPDWGDWRRESDSNCWYHRLLERVFAPFRRLRS